MNVIKNDLHCLEKIVREPGDYGDSKSGEKYLGLLVQLRVTAKDASVAYIHGPNIDLQEGRLSRGRILLVACLLTIARYYRDASEQTPPFPKHSSMADANPAKAQASQSTPTPNGQPPAATTELTPLQKKAAAKAEKAARRAGKVNAKDSGTSTPPLANGDAGSSVNGTKSAQKGKGPAQPQKLSQDGVSVSKQRRPSVAVSGVQVRDLPERLRRDSRGNKPAVEAKKAVKEVAIFSHLYGQSRKQTLEGSSREVHTAVLELGLQLSSYVICGSQARCVAMLLALKAVWASPSFLKSPH